MREEIKLYAQIEAVRRSGLTNMLDKATVQRIAYECEFFALVNYIEEADSAGYMKLLQDGTDWFDNESRELPVDEVPDEITFETTISLG